MSESNVIVSNESFDEGGGIHIGGEDAPANGLGVGSGSVVINRNLIQGNKAGDDGGGSLARPDTHLRACQRFLLTGG